MSATLQDIAAETGLSTTTVSLTLRNHPRAQRFSLTTRGRIEQVARRLGYQPNFFAAQLARPQSNLLMACVSHLVDPWAMSVMAGLEQRAMQRQHRLLITSLHQHEEPLTFHQDILGPKGVGGVAIIGGNTTNLSDKSLKALSGRGVKIVLVNRPSSHPNISSILCDNYGGAQAAAHHVLEQGARHLWILAVRGFESPSIQIRIRGFFDMIRAHGAPRPHMIPIDRMRLVDSAYEFVRTRLRTHRAPDAVLATSDPSAVGAMRALAEAGLVVGRDVAVVGFDGGLYSDTAWPPLSSVRQPTDQMGRAACDLLIDMMQGQCEAKTLTLPTELIVRTSSRMKQGFTYPREGEKLPSPSFPGFQGRSFA